MRTDTDLALDESSAVGGLFPIEQNPGVSHSGHERNHLFMNLGGAQFADVSPLTGLDDPADGRAWARLDYDRDGWQDIVTVNANSPLLRLYRNGIGDRLAGSNARNFIALRFVGSNWGAAPAEGKSARDGYGAIVRVHAGSDTWTREHRCGEGLAAQNSETMVVGIGANTTVDRIEIEWPSGQRQEIPNRAAGELLTVYEDPTQAPGGLPFAAEEYRTGRQNRSAGGSDPPALGLLRPLSGKRSNAALTMYTSMATWCPKCKGELPQLAYLRQRFGEDELAMQAVPIDPQDTQAKLEQYLTEYRPPYEMLFGLAPGDKQNFEVMVQSLTQIPEALPATVITDSEGLVLVAKAGVPSKSEIEALLDRVRR